MSETTHEPSIYPYPRFQRSPGPADCDAPQERTSEEWQALLAQVPPNEFMRFFADRPALNYVLVG